MRREATESGPLLSTTQRLGDVARAYLADLEQRMQERPLEVLEAWPQVAGEFAGMTRALQFEQGVLHVIVRNSTLLSLLHQKKNGLLSALREKELKVQVLDIKFRMG